MRSLFSLHTTQKAADAFPTVFQSYVRKHPRDSTLPLGAMCHGSIPRAPTGARRFYEQGHTTPPPPPSPHASSSAGPRGTVSPGGTGSAPRATDGAPGASQQQELLRREGPEHRTTPGPVRFGGDSVRPEAGGTKQGWGARSLARPFLTGSAETAAPALPRPRRGQLRPAGLRALRLHGRDRRGPGALRRLRGREPR